MSHILDNDPLILPVDIETILLLVIIIILIISIMEEGDPVLVHHRHRLERTKEVIVKLNKPNNFSRLHSMP
jgi:hypothetical protein